MKSGHFTNHWSFFGKLILRDQKAALCDTKAQMKREASAFLSIKGCFGAILLLVMMSHTQAPDGGRKRVFRAHTPIYIRSRWLSRSQAGQASRERDEFVKKAEMVTRITDIKAMIQNEIQWQRKKESERVQKIHHKHKHTGLLLLHQTVVVVAAAAAAVVHWILFHVITHPADGCSRLSLRQRRGSAWPKSLGRQLFVRRGNMTRKRKNSPHMCTPCGCAQFDDSNVNLRPRKSKPYPFCNFRHSTKSYSLISRILGLRKKWLILKTYP